MPPAKRTTRKTKTNAPTPVDSVRHAEKRVNIPTGELRDFLSEGQRAPIPVLYPRDPSLDPQLVWQGKDEQDRTALIVPAAPIYIQEKIEPRALIENLRDTATGSQPEPELSLFDDFDGLEGYQIVEPYHWPANWSNRMILGDSLLVMTSLAEKEDLRGKVQMIYVDPPYGIKFDSNWQVSTRKRDVRDGRADDASRQPEQIKAFRDTWALGIHSYLTYLRDRFAVSRELLSETGSIFVQIGDENLHLVRSILDEVFGSENFVAVIPFRKKTMPLGTNFIEQMDDFLIWYAKCRVDSSGRPLAKYRKLFRTNRTDQPTGSMCQLPDGERLRTRDAIKTFGALPEGTRLFESKSLEPSGPMDKGKYKFALDGVEYDYPTKGYGIAKEGMERLRIAGRLLPAGNLLRYVLFDDDKPFGDLTAPWQDTIGAQDQVFVVQTSPTVIERCMLMTTDPGDLVLDPTCGSGTTAFVAERLGRRWITTDTSRVALALARTRLMSARYPYFLLADSSEGAAKEQELLGGPAVDTDFSNDVRKGFVLRRVQHVTVGAIANNEGIREGLSRAEVDEEIRRGSTEALLVDSPYEAKQRVRVSGRFTVESLSPHRTLEGSVGTPESGGFETMILDNLRSAGVQNTYRDERLTFDRLEPFAGTWLHGEGDFTDADGALRRVAVSLGPEHGTVSPDQVKDAAREALHGAGFDLLIVCGFAFDARAGETAKEFAPPTEGFAVASEERKMGRLRVLLARTNPDLAMGDELLKRTGSGNLFMVFGEPDVAITVTDDAVSVELKGVDVYDPITGVVRSSTTDDIASWFIDTNYDGESFFVRHAYFTGGQDPYATLRRTLKADIDEAAWESLYSTRSRPFPKPSEGRIALKVINHYGDEVVQVYDVK